MNLAASGVRYSIENPLPTSKAWRALGTSLKAAATTAEHLVYAQQLWYDTSLRSLSTGVITLSACVAKRRLTSLWRTPIAIPMVFRPRACAFHGVWAMGASGWRCLFTKACSREVNQGVQQWPMVRDFTYVDDIIESLVRVLISPLLRSCFNCPARSSHQLGATPGLQHRQFQPATDGLHRGGGKCSWYYSHQRVPADAAGDVRHGADTQPGGLTNFKHL